MYLLYRPHAIRSLHNPSIFPDQIHHSSRLAPAGNAGVVHPADAGDVEIAHQDQRQTFAVVEDSLNAVVVCVLDRIPNAEFVEDHEHRAAGVVRVAGRVLAIVTVLAELQPIELVTLPERGHYHRGDLGGRDVHLLNRMEVIEQGESGTGLATTRLPVQEQRPPQLAAHELPEYLLQRVIDRCDLPRLVPEVRWVRALLEFEGRKR